MPSSLLGSHSKLTHSGAWSHAILWTRIAMNAGKLGKLTVALTAVTLFAQIQCVAACAAEDCRTGLGQTQSVPPCHQHPDHSRDQTPQPCSLHRIISSATSPHALQLERPVSSEHGFLGHSFAAICHAAVSVDTPAWARRLPDASPPGVAPAGSTTILRI